MLMTKYHAIEVEIGPLREMASELEVHCQVLLNDNTTVKLDVSWRCQGLRDSLQRSLKVNPEEMEKLHVENYSLNQEVQTTTEISRQTPQMMLFQQLI